MGVSGCLALSEISAPKFRRLLGRLRRGCVAGDAGGVAGDAGRVWLSCGD